MKVKVDIETYTEVGLNWKEGEPLTIKSVWNKRDVVEINFQGKKFFIKGDDLADGVRRAQGAES